MIQDDSRPSWLIPLERLTELWEHSSSSASRPSAALEEPLQRAGRVPVRAQGPGRASPSCPGASSEVVVLTPQWHGAKPRCRDCS
ncbi:hypothetical protein EXN66_Car005119 [Channa argus]|uniref:Uncharacterized protein n=1 Tax=Channa argus TaxID=215402 RepID=A0A6G1PGT5_CHAAH|nr:hypothetical protein EXN66_Car005119 [Channa argus]